MANFELTGPDGSKYHVTAPDSATEADLIKYVKSNYKSAEPSTPKTSTGYPTPQSLDSPPAGAEDPTGQKLIKNFSTAMEGAGTAMLGLGLTKGAVNLGIKGIAKAAESSGASSLLSKLENFVGKSLERAGAKGTNYAAGIREGTLRGMTRAGQNPGEVGLKLGGELAKSGAIKGSSIETFNEAAKLKDASGKAVGKALDNISKEAQKYGEVENPLAMDAKSSLQPLFDSWQEKAKGLTTASKNLAKPFKEVYTGLMKQAEKQGGKITTDDVRKAMKEIGPLTHKGSEEVQAAMSEVYGVMANMRDKMVTTLANQAKNPSLKADLLNSNAEYSRWLRIMPDLAKASGKEAVDGSSFFRSMRDLTRHPVVTKNLHKLGSAMKNNSLPGFPLAETGTTNKAALDRALAMLKGTKAPLVAGNQYAK